MTVTYYDGVTLELSFTPLKGGGDTVVDGDFTADITGSLRGSVSITPCGRATERDTFQSGVIVFKVDARERLMDPDYSAGAYFGNLKPNRHLRFRMTYSGSTSYLFHGYIDGYPPDWDIAGTDGTVTITAHCWFKLAARCALPESAHAYDVDLDTPTAWYRLDEASAATAALDSSGNANHAVYSGLASLDTGLIEGSPNGARTLTGTDITEQKSIGSGFKGLTGTTFTWEAWVQFPSSISDLTLNLVNNLWVQSPATTWAISGTGGSTLITSGAPSLAIYVQRTTSTTMRLDINASDELGGGTLAQLTLGSSTFDGNRHHLVLTRSGSTVTLYLDGAAQTFTSTSGTVSAGATFGTTTAWLGHAAEGAYTIDEVAIYSTALSAARVLAHYTAGSTAYAGDTVSARISRVMAMTRYASHPVSLDTSVVAVQGCDFGGGTVKLLDYLQTLERTEGGQARIFVAADGTLTFHARYHDSLSPSVTTAFSDAAGTTLPYTAIDFDGLSDQRIVNDVQVTRTDGLAQRVSDATSDQDNGTLSLVVSGVELTSDAEALDMANGLLYLYKDPHPRVRSLAITPRSAPATLMPVVRTTAVGTRISARRLPIIGSAWTREATVEGVQHVIDMDGRWVTRYLTAPADLTGSWWILGDSTYGVLGTARIGF